MVPRVGGATPPPPPRPPGAGEALITTPNGLWGTTLTINTGGINQYGVLVIACRNNQGGGPNITFTVNGSDPIPVTLVVAEAGHGQPILAFGVFLTTGGDDVIVIDSLDAGMGAVKIMFVPNGTSFSPAAWNQASTDLLTLEHTPLSSPHLIYAAICMDVDSYPFTPVDMPEAWATRVPVVPTYGGTSIYFGELLGGPGTYGAISSKVALSGFFLVGGQEPA